MLAMKFVRENPTLVKECLEKRQLSPQIVDQFLQLDEQRRKKIAFSEKMKKERNQVSEEIGLLKKQGEDAQNLILQMRTTSQKIKEVDEHVRRLEEELKKLLLTIPNLPHASVPIGAGESDNRVERHWGSLPQFDFEPQPHWDLGEKLGILDFSRAAKVTGARFVFYKGLGALLERALINFMLDTHVTQHKYKELLPPFIANEVSMTGTGQLPKFIEDMFSLANTTYFLIPTAEVPVTNYHREEILQEKDLPLCYVAYSPCFRAEAGAHGRDTRGLVRQHQFNKVELVKFCHPATSDEELEKLTTNAEKILQLLELPYRVVTLCTGDLGFSATKTYDLEVWLPSSGTYREISSCSNFTDFQARRAQIRFRPQNGGKLEFVHTLNGSGLAIGRTVAAIMENYQEADGTIRIPQVLQPYFSGREKIDKEIIQR
ncbi:MAG TPA: serine--tRNA ligase [Clostridia bacterium]|nr:serine--tRNA ligase [Clostridia bacterium]